MIANFAECGETGTSFCAECTETACTKCIAPSNLDDPVYYYIDGIECKCKYSLHYLCVTTVILYIEPTKKPSLSHIQVQSHMESMGIILLLPSIFVKDNKTGYILMIF